MTVSNEKLPSFLSRWVTGSKCICVCHGWNGGRMGLPNGPLVKTLPSNTGDRGSIPGQEAKIPHASQPHTQNIKKKEYCNKSNKDFLNGTHKKKMTTVENTIRVWCITSCMCGEVLRARQVTSMRTDLVIYYPHIEGTRGVKKESVLFIPGAKFSEKCSGKFLTFSFDKWWCWSQRTTSSHRHTFRQEQETGRNSCRVSFYLYAILIFSCKNYSD